MSVIADAPNHLKPYVFHGVDISARENQAEAIAAECPFCGKAKKFSVNVTTGEGRCWSCDTRVNAHSFIQKLHEQSLSYGGDYEGLAHERGLLFPQTLAEWGVVRSYLTGEWLIPGWSPEGKMVQLYRYCYVPEKGKWRLFATPTLNHGMHMPDYDPYKPNVALLEGPWDGMAFYEVIRRARPEQESMYEMTANDLASLYATTNVMAAPGANVFPDYWHKWFIDKNTWMLYDNQHPRVHEPTGIMQAPIGWEAQKRITQTLLSMDEKPKTISVMTWGTEGWTPNYPDGFDVRDFFRAADNILDRVRGFGALMANVLPFPEDWAPGRTATAKLTGGADLQTLPCNDYATLMKEMRLAVKSNPGLEKGMAVMLATIISTTGTGSQLWTKFVSPPSTGKTTLCEAVSVATKYCKPMSHLTGFFSGVKDKENPGEDLGLISKLHNKTLVTKDADTLLSAENLRKILAEARDIYDRTARTHFKTGSGRDYGSVNMTWILCGTSSVLELDSSELGERFLTYIIMQKMEYDFERSVQQAVWDRLYRNRGMESNGKPETRDDPQMIRFKALTGGYVEYLRENATGLQEAVTASREVSLQIMDLALFTAYMRARPSKRQHERVEREFSPRLTEQLGRMAICLAAVMNKREVDDQVMEIVREVALHSSAGITFDLCSTIIAMGDRGIEAKNLSLSTGDPTTKASEYLKFLRNIEVLEIFTHSIAPGVMSKPKYRLREGVRNLWYQIMGAPATDTEDYGRNITAEIEDIPATSNGQYHYGDGVPAEAPPEPDYDAIPESPDYPE